MRRTASSRPVRHCPRSGGEPRGWHAAGWYVGGFRTHGAGCRSIRGIGTRGGERCPRVGRPCSATSSTSWLTGMASSSPSGSPTRRHRTPRVAELLDDSPVRVRLLATDTGYSQGRLRRLLDRRGIEAHIPLHTRHREHRQKRIGFHITPEGNLRCPAGKVLRRTTFYAKDETWQYAARVPDCQGCPLRSSCLPPRSKRCFVQLSVDEREFQEAERRLRTARYRRLARRRRTVVEGVFARLDRLGFQRARRFGLDDVPCEGYLAAFAHNLLKVLRYQRGPTTGARTQQVEGMTAPRKIRVRT